MQLQKMYRYLVPLMYLVYLHQTVLFAANLFVSIVLSFLSFKPYLAVLKLL